MQTHFVRLTTEVRRRMAWLISRAWEPTVASPIWPSSSARETRAATESMMMTSIEFDRIRASVMFSASSPLSGCETSRSSSFTPTTRAYFGSRACSTSMKAASPPRRWASAITLRQNVVFPDDSGPKISMMRPRGSPPTPRARSIASEPVEMVSTTMRVALPRRMIEPSPNCLVIAETASSMFLARAGSAARSAAVAPTLRSAGDLAGGSGALDMGVRWLGKGWKCGCGGKAAQKTRRGKCQCCSANPPAAQTKRNLLAACRTLSSPPPVSNACGICGRRRRSGNACVIGKKTAGCPPLLIIFSTGAAR